MDVQKIKDKLERGMPPSILLGSARFINSDARNSSELTDPRYLPFYYYLGSQCRPRCVLQIGSKLGLPGLCFLQSCKTVEAWSILDLKNDSPVYSSTIVGNTCRFLRGQCSYIVDEPTRLQHKICSKNWDLILVLDENGPNEYMNVMWDHLATEGLLVVDYIFRDSIGESFHTFCRVKNRVPVVFETRHGVGIVER